MSYTREIPAGGEGEITLKVNTRGYGGHDLSKTATVYSNDSQNKKVSLRMSGRVERYAIIEPNRVRLFGKAGEDIAATVTVTPEPKYPFRLVTAKARTESNIRCKIEEPGESGGAYRLIIQNIRKTQGRYTELVTIKTDRQDLPDIQIYVYGNILVRPPPPAPAQPAAPAADAAKTNG